MTDLTEILHARIRATGPLTVAEFMAAALGHPEHGYYRRRDPLGADGDFTTAPEVSQMFGELIGLWCAVVWQAMGAPDPVSVVELGPGRGTLMADALRAAVKMPGFGAAARLHLVETSPVLREKQARALADAAPIWHDTVEDLPRGPMLLIANEFFDALPVRQFVRVPDGWCERRVDVDSGAGFRFVLSLPRTVVPEVPEDLLDVNDGSVVEVRPDGEAIAFALGRRLAEDGGAALVIDYGHPQTAPGETLQAVREHAFADVLSAPGTADLTAHVDFAALARAAADGGAAVYGPLTQQRFLGRLGIEARAAALASTATAEQLADLEAAFQRLTAADQMGTLFKAMALTHPLMPPPPAFE